MSRTRSTGTPGDWEALQEAKAQTRPLLLSIGYSVYHWCHVMERESFENEAIPSVKNQYLCASKLIEKSSQGGVL